MAMAITAAHRGAATQQSPGEMNPHVPCMLTWGAWHLEAVESDRHMRSEFIHSHNYP